MTFLTYCYMFTQEEKERYIRLYKESPSIFGYDLQQKGLEEFIKHISQQFTGNTLYSPDQFTAKYIINDNQMIAFTTQNAQWKAFSDPLDKWQPIKATDHRFNAYIQTIISYINERNALANSILYQTMLRRS